MHIGHATQTQPQHATMSETNTETFSRHKQKNHSDTNPNQQKVRTIDEQETVTEEGSSEINRSRSNMLHQRNDKRLAKSKNIHPIISLK